MKKRIIIIISVILIAISIVRIYQTFAISDEINGQVYDIVLNDSNSSIVIPSKTSKVVYYQIANTNKGKVQYSVGYISDNENVYAKKHFDSDDNTTGIIDYGEYKFIKLVLINNSTEDSTITLTTVLGYEHGGDLVLPDNVTIAEDKKNYLGTIIKNDLTKDKVSSITFENNNIVPSGDDIVSYDVSKDGDGSIMLWYGPANDEGNYDVYIGSDNGMTSITSGAILFAYFYSLKTIDFKYFDTSEATNLVHMFQSCSNLTTLDLSGWNTSSVTNMNGVFYDCSSLTTLDLSGWNTSSVTNMNSLFLRCYSLTTLNLSGWDTSSVTDMYGVFYGCSSLTTLDLSGWNTSSVTSMYDMFRGCSKLQILDISNFDTSNVTNMNSMFHGCSSLTTLDLSGWDTSSVTDMYAMFYNNNKLKTIYVSDMWTTTNVSNSNLMFYNCTSLKGGAGTVFSTSYTDKTYAKIDGGEGDPGYLTLKV